MVRYYFETMTTFFYDNILLFTQIAPVPIVDLIRSFNIDVAEEQFPDNIYGKIEVIDGNYQISVNVSSKLFRKRFTMAHLLGHYLLHRDYFFNEFDICFWGTFLYSFPCCDKSGSNEWI